MPFDGQRFHVSPTGAQINLYTKWATGEPRGVIQVNHGLAEHAARYARFADFMAVRGFHTYAHDHRGHGYTKAPDAPPGIFGTPDGGGKVIADIASVHNLIRREQPYLPIIIFGHSMGGMIALNYVMRRPEWIRAAAVWNTNFSAGLLGRLAQAILAYEQFRLGSGIPSRILPRLTFQAWAKKVPNHRTAFDWLSRDSEEVDKYVADPLCGWDACISLWQNLLGFVFFVSDDANFMNVPKALPFNIIGGEKDPATNGGKAITSLVGRMQRMGFSNLLSTIYKETRHDSLNEVNRNIIMEEFSAWVEQVIAHR